MIKEDIKNDLLEKGYFSNKLSDYGMRIWRDFVWGSWSEQDYLNCLEMAKSNNKRKLRSFVISNYCSLVAREYSCSYSHAQKCMVDLFNRQSLESINDLLIEELKALKEA